MASSNSQWVKSEEVADFAINIAEYQLVQFIAQNKSASIRRNLTLGRFSRSNLSSYDKCSKPGNRLVNKKVGNHLRGDQWAT